VLVDLYSPSTLYSRRYGRPVPSPMARTRSPSPDRAEEPASSPTYVDLDALDVMGALTPRRFLIFQLGASTGLFSQSLCQPMVWDLVTAWWCCSAVPRTGVLPERLSGVRVYRLSR